MDVILYFDRKDYTKRWAIPADRFNKGEAVAFQKGRNHRSIYTYDDKHVDKYLRDQRKKGALTNGGRGIASFSGYQDPKGYKICAPLIPVDIDNDVLELSAGYARAWCDWLDSIGADYYLHFSGGKGYHVDIPCGVIGYQPHEQFPKITKRFVAQMAKQVLAFRPFVKGLEYDKAIYHRGGKLRTSGSIEEGRTYHKTLIEPYVLDYNYGFGQRLSHTQQPSPDYDRPFDRCDALHKLWLECVEYIEQPPLIEVKIAQSTPGQPNGSARPRIANLDALTQRVVASRGAKLVAEDKYEICCPFHNDTRPSAAYWPDRGSVWCSTCNRPYLAHEVGPRFGITIQWDQPVVVQAKTTPLQEAREQWLEDMRASVMDGTKIHVWVIPAGGGKSWAFRRISEERKDLGFGFVGPNHKLNEEAALDTRDSIQLREPWRHEPRCITTPMVGGERAFRQEEMQLKSELWEERRKVCATCPLMPRNVKDGETPCAFYKAIEEVKGDGTSFLAHAYLQYPDAFSALNSDRDVIIIDENPLDQLLRVDEFRLDLLEPLLDCDLTYQTTFGTESIAKVVRPIITEGRMPPMHFPNGQDQLAVYDPLIHSATDSTIDGLDRRPRQSTLDIADAEGYHGLQRLNVHEEATKFVNLLRSKRINDIRIVSDKNGKRLLVRSWTDPRVYPQQLHILDASPTPWQLGFWRQLGAEIHTYDVSNAGSKLIQDPSCSYSRKSKKRQLRDHEDPEYKGFDRYAATLAYCRGLVDQYGLDQFGVITHKGCGYTTKILDDLGIKKEDRDDYYWWFGNLRGLNSWGGKKALVIMGDPGPNPLAYEKEAFRSNKDRAHITYDTPEYETPRYLARYRVVQAVTSVNLFGGCYMDVADPRDADTWHTWSGERRPLMLAGNEYIDRLIRTEIYQAIYRVRPLNHDVTITYLGVQDVGRRVVEQIGYECNPRLLGDPRPNVDVVDDVDRARLYVNCSYKSYSEISELTGFDRDFLSSLKEPGAFRDHRDDRIQALKAQGFSQIEVADHMGISVRTVKRSWSKRGDSE